MATQILHIPIDKAGRVVLPKPLRERLGLAPGTQLEVIEEADRILLKPVQKKARLVKKGKWVVVEFDNVDHEFFRDKNSIVDLIKSEREKRNRSFW